MIYKHLYTRPICVVPAVSFYRHRPYYNRQDQGNIKYSVYRYQWAGRLQVLPHGEGVLPSRDGSPRDLRFEWKTDDPTQEERELIEFDKPLPDTKSEDEDRSDIESHHFVDENGKSWIIRAQTQYIAGFYGIKLLRSCKQLYMEGAEILYGSNVFVFDAGNYSGYSLEDSHDHIPTMPSLESVDLSPSEEKVSEDVSRIFDKKIRQPRLIWQDTMLLFFNTIGARNTALLKSIKLSGAFCDEDRNYGRYRGRNYILDNKDYKFQSMVDYLPIYACVLKNACHGLRTVYLDGEVTLSALQVLEDDDEWIEVQTAHEILNDCVGSFVEALPQLTEFHLGWSGDLHGPEALTWTQSEWEKQSLKWGEAALNWVDVVQGRLETSSLAADGAEDGVEGPEDRAEDGHVEKPDATSDIQA